MMSYERPPEPSDYRESVRSAQREVLKAIRQCKTPAFPDRWKSYRTFFATAQHSKCAFCERDVTSQDPHLDHFAPKAEVEELSANPAEHGRETHDGLPKVSGRKAARTAMSGYWWLAYDWSNYVLVCGVCNSKWKRCFFPVAANPRRWPPVPNVYEEPLLINPFDDEAPWRSFYVNDLGAIEGVDPAGRGAATIETCGLDRPTLHNKRQKIAERAYRFAHAFREHNSPYDLANLWELGQDDRDFAGTVRGIAERETGLTWEQLCARLSPG